MTTTTTVPLRPEAIGDLLTLVSGLLADGPNADGHATVTELHILLRDDAARPAIIDYIRATRAAGGEQSADADEALGRVIARLRVPRTEGGPGLLPVEAIA